MPLLGFHTIPGDDTVVDVGDFNTMVDDGACGGGGGGGRGGNDWGGGSLITSLRSTISSYVQGEGTGASYTTIVFVRFTIVILPTMLFVCCCCLI